MTSFRILLCLAWLAALVVGVHAYVTEGMVAGHVFGQDIVNIMWRGQFDVDFLCHLVVLALWVAWRDKFSLGGIVTAVLCVLGGGVVSFAYLLALTWTSRGDMRQVLLGAHRR
jgi:hypothetical protein